MRRSSAMMMAVAMMAASIGPGVAGVGSSLGPPVRGLGGGGPPVPRPRSRPSMRGTWNPLGGIAVARRNRLKGRKGGRR